MSKSLKSSKQNDGDLLHQYATHLKNWGNSLPITKLTKEKIKAASVKQLKEWLIEAKHHYEISKITVNGVGFQLKPRDKVHEKSLFVELWKKKGGFFGIKEFEIFLNDIDKNHKNYIHNAKEHQKRNQKYEIYIGNGDKSLDFNINSAQMELKILEDSGALDHKSKDLLRKNFQDGDAALHEFYSNPDLSEKDILFISSMAIAIKQEFSIRFQKVLGEIKSEKLSDLPKTEEKADTIWSKLYSGWKNAKPWLIYLLGKGFDLSKWILSNPTTARIISVIALEFRDSICRQISLKYTSWNYIHGYKEDDGQFSRYTRFLKEGIPGALTAFFESPIFDDFWDTLGTSVTAGFTGAISLLPFGGLVSYTIPIISVLVKSTTLVAKESVRFAAEKCQYVTDITETYNHLFELINPLQCFWRPIEAPKQEKEELKQALLMHNQKEYRKNHQEDNEMSDEEKEESPGTTMKRRNQLSSYASKSLNQTPLFNPSLYKPNETPSFLPNPLPKAFAAGHYELKKAAAKRKHPPVPVFNQPQQLKQPPREEEGEEGNNTNNNFDLFRGAQQQQPSPSPKRKRNKNLISDVYG